MYHIHGKGSHYEIGFHFGKRLRIHHIHLLDIVPFEITQEHISFANACIPTYTKYYPQLLEEIRGISDGNECSYEILRALLLSMYCIMPQNVHCSCMAVRNQKGVHFARNSDFLVEIEKNYLNTMYTFTDQGYSFQGNTTAFVEMEDGVNEHGLIIGLTSVHPKQIQPGWNAGMMLRLFLETCTCVDDVIALLYQLPIASSQTFTLADAQGTIALIECSSSSISIHNPTSTNAYVCATNRFHSQEMQKEVVQVDDDWFAKERYTTMKDVLDQTHHQVETADIMDIMAGKHGFLCQYDRKSGKDTVWSIVYDVIHKVMYRAEGNPSRKQFKKDTRLNY